MPIGLLFIPHIQDGFRSLHEASSASSLVIPDFVDDTSPLSLIPTYDLTFFIPYLILTGNLLTQLVCVSGVNQLTSVRPPVPSLHSFILTTSCTNQRFHTPTASFLRLDKSRPYDPQSNKFVLQRLVVRQWLERTARCRCRNGLPRLDFVHCRYIAWSSAV